MVAAVFLFQYDRFVVNPLFAFTSINFSVVCLVLVLK